MMILSRLKLFRYCLIKLVKKIIGCHLHMDELWNIETLKDKLLSDVIAVTFEQIF